MQKCTAHDEQIFTTYLKNHNITPTKYSHVVLDNGLGDHYAFKYWINQYLTKNAGKKHIFYTCYPEVFSDIKDVTLASISDAKTVLGDLSKYNVYRYMFDNKWTLPLNEAFRRIYQLPTRREPPDKQMNGIGSTIIISPFSFNSAHPKSYPYWNELIHLMKSSELRSYKLIQVGRNGEDSLPGIDEYMWSLPLIKLQNLISECRTWIAGDNFLQHLVNSMSVAVKGIVLWGVSDPNIFGYQYNLNILKSRNYLRPDQFEFWKNVTRKNDAFVEPHIVLENIKRFLSC